MKKERRKQRSAKEMISGKKMEMESGGVVAEYFIRPFYSEEVEKILAVVNITGNMDYCAFFFLSVTVKE